MSQDVYRLIHTRMKLGIAIADFTQPGGPKGIARHMSRLARTAEEFGFTRIIVMQGFGVVAGRPVHDCLPG
ncbi:hypothetical protein ACFVYG_44395 [Streptomyces sp. NPDC058256]|uniref:hypothetical protein n=1 Tax=Streptomyces sp. NPDC058256 TaxID=3346408 RepID=UPI0036F0EE62